MKFARFHLDLAIPYYTEVSVATGSETTSRQLHPIYKLRWEKIISAVRLKKEKKTYPRVLIIP